MNRRLAAAVVAAMLATSLTASCSGSLAPPPADAGGAQDAATSCGGPAEPCCNGTACNAGLTCGGGGTCAPPSETDATVRVDAAGADAGPPVDVGSDAIASDAGAAGDGNVNDVNDANAARDVTTNDGPDGACSADCGSPVPPTPAMLIFAHTAPGVPPFRICFGTASAGGTP